METTYQPEFRPTTREILGVLEDEIAMLGGSVPDVYDDGQHLMARGVLSTEAEIRPDDPVRAGVALRVIGPQILVHPYTFRLVCENGAIAAHAHGTSRVERILAETPFVSEYDVAKTLAEVSAAVQASAAPRSFRAVVNEMRTTAETEADLALHLLPQLASMPPALVDRILPQILGLFRAGTDRSVFGLLNAVTAHARETRDPAIRWALEELGGTMPARLVWEEGSGKREARAASVLS